MRWWPGRSTPLLSAEFQHWRGLPDSELQQAVQAQLALGGLTAPFPVQASGYRRFDTNSAFWSDALADRLRPGMRLELSEFCVLEWFPRVPGLFHTEAAEYARRDAKSHLHVMSPELESEWLASNPREPEVYDLYGKSKMLEGGMGCVRLRERETSEGLLWFLSASSTGVAHEGIPVAVSQAIYGSLMDELIDQGSVRCRLTGTLRSFPLNDPSWQPEYPGLPHFYLLVDGAEILHQPRDRRVQPFASAAVTFLERDRWARIGAAYIGFIPGANGDLGRRVGWLERYIHEVGEGTVVTDFDEQMGRFEGAVFSIEKVRSGRVDEAQALRLAHIAGYPAERAVAQVTAHNVFINNFAKDSVNMGDTFSNIGAGATIVNRSLLQGSFNSEVRPDADLAQALEVIAAAIEESGNQPAADTFNSFLEELGRPEPRTGPLRSLWDGTIAALPSLTSFAEAVSKISGLFT